MASGTEKTFMSYSRDQGDAYAQARKDYSSRVYQAILDRHTSSSLAGGQLGLLMDVGTGPGTAVRALAPNFADAIGLDASEGMIAAARSVGGKAGSGRPIQFEVSPAEDLGSGLLPSPVADGNVDLIVAATAAHWFDMPRFWKAASRVLRPGGSVALMTASAAGVHPSVPNAAAIQAVIDHHREVNLAPYMMPGNLMVRKFYADLPLPWSSTTTAASMGDGDQDLGFDRDSFYRKEWGPDNGEADSFMGDVHVDMDTFEKILNTDSPQTRYHQAHPEDVGTDNDVVKVLRRKVETLLREAGVEAGKECLRTAVPGVLIMLRKK